MDYITRSIDPLRNIAVFRETCTACGHEVRESVDIETTDALIECPECGSMVPAKNRVRWI